MSVFSGKCDLYDSMVMIPNNTIDEEIANTKIYINNSPVPLDIKSEKDASAFYPFVPYLQAGGKDFSIYRIGTKSFIDIEEEERLNWKLQRVIRYYKKCKRKKVEFDEKEALKEIGFLSRPSGEELEIVKRVKEYGLKATTEDLHDNMHDYYRKKWYDEMVRLGWKEDQAGCWIYGLSRWFKIRKEICCCEQLE